MEDETKNNDSKRGLDDIYHQVPPDYWDTSYKKNILQRLWYDLRFRAMKKVLKRLPNGAKILDVGCGSGFSMEMSIPKNKNFEIYGIDVTEELIEFARKKRPHFHFRRAYGESLPFLDKIFDAVLYLDVIEHLTDPVKSLKEAHRVLNNEGFIVILVAKENNWLFKIIWWFWKKLKGKVWEDAHQEIYDERLLEKQMNEAGFRVTEMNKTHFKMGLVAVGYKNK